MWGSVRQHQAASGSAHDFESKRKTVVPPSASRRTCAGGGRRVAGGSAPSPTRQNLKTSLCSSQGRPRRATLKGKLTEKVRYRPTAAIEPLLPAGADTLESLALPECRWWLVRGRAGVQGVSP